MWNTFMLCFCNVRRQVKYLLNQKLKPMGENKFVNEVAEEAAAFLEWQRRRIPVLTDLSYCRHPKAEPFKFPEAKCRRERERLSFFRVCSQECNRNLFWLPKKQNHMGYQNNPHNDINRQQCWQTSFSLFKNFQRKKHLKVMSTRHWGERYKIYRFLSRVFFLSQIIMEWNNK